MPKRRISCCNYSLLLELFGKSSHEHLVSVVASSKMKVMLIEEFRPQPVRMSSVKNASCTALWFLSLCQFGISLCLWNTACTVYKTLPISPSALTDDWGESSGIDTTVFVHFLWFDKAPWTWNRSSSERKQANSYLAWLESVRQKSWAQQQGE